MKQKYNLALIPISKGDQVITLAKKFSMIADDYLLGDNSLPHITLHQFQAEEKELDFIWKQVREIMEENLYVFTFSKFSCITFDNNIFWISLLPDNCEILHKLHGHISNITGFPLKVTFDPHMTLINTKNNEYEKEARLVFNMYKPITERFRLSLGVSDDIGQLTSILYA